MAGFFLFFRKDEIVYIKVRFSKVTITCSCIPLVNRAIVGTGHQLEVILGPGHVGHLALVTLQHVQVSEGDRVVHVDGILQFKNN